MEIALTPDQEAQLQYVAASTGKAVGELAQEYFTQALEEKAQFLQRIDRARASYDRGEYLEEAEMDSLIEKNFGR